MIFILWSAFACLVMAELHLRVIVLGYNRPRSLLRALRSLQDADYTQNIVPLEVHIDGPPSPKTLASYLCAHLFEWKHGPKRVQIHRTNHGVFKQWINAWKPDWNSQEWALIVEDDVLLSPFFYHHLISLYNNNAVAIKGNLYGIALQRAQWQLGMTEKLSWRRLDLVDERYPPLFAYPAVGTWGQVFFPRAWISFKHWLQHNHQKTMRIRWDGLVHEKWRMERKGDLFSYWFTRYALETHSFNLYFNLPDKAALAISTRERGKYQRHSLGPSQQLCMHRPTNYESFYYFDGCFEQIHDEEDIKIIQNEKQLIEEQKNFSIHCHYKPGRYPHLRQHR